MNVVTTVMPESTFFYKKRLKHFWGLLPVIQFSSINMECDGTKFCVSEVTQEVALYGLQMTVQAWNNHVIPGSFFIMLVIPELISVLCNFICSLAQREKSGVYFFFSCRLISPFIQTKGELKGVIPLCKFTPITTQKEVKK